ARQLNIGASPSQRNAHDRHAPEPARALPARASARRPATLGRGRAAGGGGPGLPALLRPGPAAARRRAQPPGPLPERRPGPGGAAMAAAGALGHADPAARLLRPHGPVPPRDRLGPGPEPRRAGLRPARPRPV